MQLGNMLGKIKVNYDGNTISITLSLISLMLKLPDLRHW